MAVRPRVTASARTAPQAPPPKRPRFVLHRARAAPASPTPPAAHGTAAGTAAASAAAKEPVGLAPPGRVPALEGVEQQRYAGAKVRVFCRSGEAGATGWRRGTVRSHRRRQPPEAEQEREELLVGFEQPVGGASEWMPLHGNHDLCFEVAAGAPLLPARPAPHFGGWPDGAAAPAAAAPAAAGATELSGLDAEMEQFLAASSTLLPPAAPSPESSDVELDGESSDVELDDDPGPRNDEPEVVDLT